MIFGNFLDHYNGNSLRSRQRLRAISIAECLCGIVRMLHNYNMLIRKLKESPLP